MKAVEAEKLAITTKGAKAFERYKNLFSGEARQTWEKITKAQVTRASWEDVYRVMHTDTPTKTWGSACDCIRFHLQRVFWYNACETHKYYIMNALKKPNQVLICEFFVPTEQLNSYLEMLPCLYYAQRPIKQPKRYCPWMIPTLGLICCVFVWLSGRLNMT